MEIIGGGKIGRKGFGAKYLAGETVLGCRGGGGVEYLRPHSALGMAVWGT